ncbi:MAG: GspE/PulE family protein [Acutalibacteraceae bacterium]
MIWEILLTNEVITHEQLSDALRWQRSHPDEDVGNILLSRGIVNESQLLAAYAQRLDVALVEKDLVVKRPEVLKLVPESLARRYGIMPLDINNNKILIAVSNPEDMSVIEDVKMSSRMDVSFLLSPRENVNGAIERYYKNVELFYREEQAEVQTINIVSTDTAKKMDEIESNVNNTPVVKLVNNLVQQAYVRQVSDIHIEPFENDVLVRMRIDGDLVEVMRLAPSALNSVISRIKILSGMNIAEKRVPQDGRFAFSNDEFKVDLRVSTIPTIYGEKCVMRLLNTGGENLLSFEQLGMTKENIARFEHMLSAPNGIILVTGPTGSGKSTTLYAVLNRLRKPTINITTIEDPVEKQMFGVNQVQVNTKAGMTFANGLRALLRQDPDVIMIGEIRDYETAEIAVRASITGHLVLSTLHTNDSVATIVRLIDMGVPPYLVSASVNAIIAQRLVKRLCPYCKQKRALTDAEKVMLEDDSINDVYEPVGCPECNHMGYSGRIAIYEIVELDHTIRKMISAGAPVDEIRKVAAANGAEFLADNLRQLVAKGVTSMDEYNRIIYTVS